MVGRGVRGWFDLARPCRRGRGVRDRSEVHSRRRHGQETERMVGGSALTLLGETTCPPYCRCNFSTEAGWERAGMAQSKPLDHCQRPGCESTAVAAPDYTNQHLRGSFCDAGALVFRLVASIPR